MSDVLSDKLSYELERGSFVGIVDNMSNYQYHSLKSYYSSSDLKYMASGSPKHFKAKYIDKIIPEKDATPKMLLGSIVHCKILTPKDFVEDFFVMPDCDLRTKEGKAVRDAAKDEAAGRTLVPSEMNEQADKMFYACSEVFDGLLKDTKREISLFWKCPFSGFSFKARCDALSSEFLFELKTTESASPEVFSRVAYNLNYDLSIYHYLTGLAQVGVACGKAKFLVLETAPPYVAQSYLVGESFMETGHKKWLDAVTKLERGLKENKWPGYVAADECPILEAPKWAQVGVSDGV